ncbi:MAG TPA: CoA-binding protein [Syntrophales bacterium]|nr:CoA-binding protein [Syntrophales bacterium]HOL58336.1 CoA-binding protein [Syntrophales bacterium]HPO34505.1 CoA-binding protein [Syntrophales bacterium]
MIPEAFLQPNSIVLFGSVAEGRHFGAGVIVRDLLAWHYPGRIYPIHPSAKSVYGLKVWDNLWDVPEVPDLAVVITSYRQVPSIVHELGKKGVQSVIVVSDGFGEAGPPGKERERELLSLARSYGMRIVGPNTVGVFNVQDRVTTVPYDRGYPIKKAGGLSVITQTGMYGPQAMAWQEFAPGVNKIIDLGNMCDVDETDCLEYLGEDEQTKVISLYLEHTRRPDDLLRTARQVAKKKPILCLKPGKAPGAARAMASHTGSLAGNDVLYRALMTQAGLLMVEEYEDLRDYATLFLLYGLPRANRLGILTFSGAVGIQAIDLAQEGGLEIAELSPTSRERLAKIHETLAGHPVDVGPASAVVGAGIFDLFRGGFDVLKDDPAVDLIYINTYVSSVVHPAFYEDTLRYIASFREKPVAIWSYGPIPELVHEFGRLAGKCGLAFFSTTRKAIRSLSLLVKYAKLINVR